MVVDTIYAINYTCLFTSLFTTLVTFPNNYWDTLINFKEAIINKVISLLDYFRNPELKIDSTDTIDTLDPSIYNPDSLSQEDTDDLNNNKVIYSVLALIGVVVFSGVIYYYYGDQINEYINNFRGPRPDPGTNDMANLNPRDIQLNPGHLTGIAPETTSVGVQSVTTSPIASSSTIKLDDVNDVWNNNTPKASNQPLPLDPDTFPKIEDWTKGLKGKMKTRNITPTLSVNLTESRLPESVFIDAVKISELDNKVLDFVQNNNSWLLEQVNFLTKFNPIQNKMFIRFTKEVLEVEPTNTEELIHAYATFKIYREAMYPGLKVDALSLIIPE